MNASQVEPQGDIDIDHWWRMNKVVCGAAVRFRGRPINQYAEISMTLSKIPCKSTLVDLKT
jgi:hypothetical protein